jgi:hypothetical protein
MESAVHGFPLGYFVRIWIPMDFLKTERSVVFEALGSDLAFLDAYAAQSFDRVVP